ncbi:phytanoyl-CoA dioxygenase [Aureococcus anophagefferens]|nr:phytanoyl-CoA dioxygenase [Aureococcus anophagefferens]
MAAQLAEALTRASDAAVLLERGDAAEACALYRKAVKLTAKAVRSDAALAEAAALMADALLAKLAAAKGAEPSAAPADRVVASEALAGAALDAAARRSSPTARRGAFVPRGREPLPGSVGVKLDACGHGAFDAAAADLARFARRDDRWLWPLARRVLGDDVVLAYVGLVASFPGSDDQPWHADGVKLFPGHGGELPAHALNWFVPLAALGAELARGGAPRDVFAPELAPGDLLVYDQRTVHRGVANVSQHSRPILYLLFCRPWFREHINFGSTSLFDDDDEPPREKKKHRS